LHPGPRQPKNVVIGIPYPFHIDRIIRLADVWFPSSSLWMVNPYMNYQLCKEININSDGYKHPLPSLGLTALWHLNRLKVNLKSKIYICGFNWYYDHEKELMQGYKLNHQPRPTHFNHDYWKESTWIVNHLVGKYNWNFSKSCMSILNKVKEAML
jgi:hypothetical protein